MASYIMLLALIAKTRPLRSYLPSCKMQPSTVTTSSTQETGENETASFLSDPGAEQEPPGDHRDMVNLSEVNWPAEFAQNEILHYLGAPNTPPLAYANEGRPNSSRMEGASGWHDDFSRSPCNLGVDTAFREKYDKTSVPSASDSRESKSSWHVLGTAPSAITYNLPSLTPTLSTAENGLRLGPLGDNTGSPKIAPSNHNASTSLEPGQDLIASLFSATPPRSSREGTPLFLDGHSGHPGISTNASTKQSFGGGTAGSSPQHELSTPGLRPAGPLTDQGPSVAETRNASGDNLSLQMSLRRPATSDPPSADSEAGESEDNESVPSSRRSRQNKRLRSEYFPRFRISPF
jgi:hypothetical protein